MNCKKCRYCIQVSKRRYEVKCSNKKVSDDPNVWVDEPEYCKFYLKKGTTVDTVLDYFEALKLLKENYENGRIESDDRN